ncbi:MAG: thioredoxin family protein, partial [Flavobacteriales bacterium]
MLDYSNIFDKEALAYTSYRELVDELLAREETTGPDNSEEMLHYSKMNVQRMNRVDKTAVLSEELLSTLNSLKGSYRLLVITEGWCGDAAQIVPVINKMVAAVPDKLELKLTLRDKNLPLIDAHLTNGGRAIPVLLVLDEEGNLL